MIFRLAIGVLLGVCWVQTQRSLPAISDFLTVALVSLLVLAIGLYRRRWLPWIWPFPVSIVAALLTTIVAQSQLDQRLHDGLDRQSLWLEFVIEDLPTRHERGWRFEVMVRAAKWNAEDERPIANFPVRGVMHWYDNGKSGLPADLAPGQRWALQARVRQPSGTLNPAGFDYEAWMFEKQLYFSATVQDGKKVPSPNHIGQEDGFQIRVDRLRDRIRQQVEMQIPTSPARGVIAALLVGDQRAISVDEWAIFQRTGVSHLMSISGLHVTMFAGLAAWLGGLVWRCLCIWPIAAALWLPVQSFKAIFAVLGSVGYAMLAGFAVPAQRTALMVLVVSMATIVGIRASPWAVLSAALLAVLLMDPIAVLAPGFWLSFMAVGLLFTLADSSPATPAERQQDRRPQSRCTVLKQKLFQTMRQAAHAQMAITFGLLPVTVLLFQQVVLVGPLANAIAIPVVSFLVTPAAMLGVLETALTGTGFGFAVAGWLQETLMGFLVWCAGLSFASMDWPSPGIIRTTIASSCLLIALGRVLPMRWQRYRHLGWLGLIALFGAAPAPPADGQMEAVFVDVGQGSSVLIRTHRHTLLYDTGPSFGTSDAGQRMVLPTLRRFGIRKIDRLIISHGDQDHDGGYASIAAVMPIGATLTPTPQDYPGARPCRAGENWQWDGIRFDVLHPTESVTTDRNAASCVLRIQDAHGGSLLLAGDIPLQTEQMLAAHHTPSFGARSNGVAHRLGAGLSSQVVLLPHHGSKTSSSQEFLDAVGPQIAVIQAGYRNRFGHPHAEVLARVSEAGISQLVRTDLQGALSVSWQHGRPLVRDFWETHQRYWHLRRQED